MRFGYYTTISAFSAVLFGYDTDQKSFSLKKLFLKEFNTP